MNESEKKGFTKSLEAAIGAVTKIVSLIGKLQKENPKVLYGGIAVVVIGLLFLMTSGTGTIGSVTSKQVTVGQSYTVANPNGPGGRGDTMLVPIPGTIAAYDASEKISEESGCSVPAGARATVLDKASGYGVEGLYVKLRIEDGICAGKEGWTTIANLE